MFEAKKTVKKLLILNGIENTVWTRLLGKTFTLSQYGDSDLRKKKEEKDGPLSEPEARHMGNLRKYLRSLRNRIVFNVSATRLYRKTK